MLNLINYVTLYIKIYKLHIKLIVVMKLLDLHYFYKASVSDIIITNRLLKMDIYCKWESAGGAPLRK